ncbi:MAG TPA: hypothetical protein VKR58_03245, partial [Aquella sp.]|nr:hypothetical protein [Aquella sp.]
ITTNDNENQITIQVPAETTFPAKYNVTFTGVNTLNKTTDNSLITNDSQITFDSPDTVIPVAVTKDNIAQTYNVSITKREPYFTSYYNDQGVSECAVDMDGNVWLSDPTKFGTFNQVEAFANMPFFKACQPISGWHLPNKQQAQSLLDTIPSEYRIGTSGKTAIDWFNMQKDSKGVKLFALDSFETNYWLSEPGSVMGVNTHNIYSVTPSLSTKLPVWPVASDGTADNFRTITNFNVEPQNADKTVIVGNQIFIPVEAWHPKIGVANSITLNFNNTGGKVTINNSNQYKNGDTITVFPSTSAVIIPITVTSVSGKKNIYTLVLAVPTSSTLMPTPASLAPQPPFPGAWSQTVCTSESSVDITDKLLINNVVATVGSNVYINALPPPGTCWPIYLGYTTKHDLAVHPVLWWSISNKNPVNLTWFSGDQPAITPVFEWHTSSTDPSGYALSVTVPNSSSRRIQQTGYSSLASSIDDDYWVDLTLCTSPNSDNPKKILYNYLSYEWKLTVGNSFTSPWFEIPNPTNPQPCITPAVDFKTSYNAVINNSTIALHVNNDEWMVPPGGVVFPSYNFVGEMEYCREILTWKENGNSYNVTFSRECHFPENLTPN